MQRLSAQRFAEVMTNFRDDSTGTAREGCSTHSKAIDARVVPRLAGLSAQRSAVAGWTETGNDFKGVAFGI
jgi:hypothetical protein